jgi:hypothetical protein
MKLFSFLVLFLCLAQISHAQKQGSLLTDNELKGKVKKVTKLLFLNGKSETDTLQQPDITTLEFDEKGNMHKEIRLGSQFPFYRIDYRYNTNNTITGKKYDSDRDLVGGFTYKYDDSGNLIEIKREGTIFGPPRQIFKNDAEGHPTEIDNYVDDNTLGSRILIKYNENGLKSAQSSYKINGQLNRSESYTYDTLKNLIRCESYYPNGYLEEKQVFTDSDWDQNDNWYVRTIVI